MDGNIEAMRLEVKPFVADIWMPTVNLGGSSIGSVAIDNLQIGELRWLFMGVINRW